MSDELRYLVLKAALLLILLEGWAKPSVVNARLGADAGQAVAWLWRHGYIDLAEDRAANVVRWQGGHTFTQLWARLVPERPCPVQLCSSPRAERVRQLR